MDIINDGHDFPGAAGVASNVSNTLLIMSLLEETQGDQDHDEERLSTLIRALEVELLHPTSSTTSTEDDHQNAHHINDDQLIIGSIGQDDDFQPLDVGIYVTGTGDCPETQGPGFAWIDHMEMEILGSSSSKGSTDGDHESSAVDWYVNMDSCVHDIDCTSMVGGSQEYCKPKSTTFDHEEHWVSEFVARDIY